MGAQRADGKFYTGPDYGWQTRESASRARLLGSEVLGGYFGEVPALQPPAPGQVTTAITGNFSGGSRASSALQNAAAGVRANGLGVAAPAWSWDANPTMRDAAMTAGQAAATARGDTFDSNGMITSRGGGYLSRGQLPAASNPANDAYWARPDMDAWARANQDLARQQGWDPNKDYQAAMQAQQLQGVGPVADVAQYGQDLQALQGVSGAGPVADSEAYGRILESRRLAQGAMNPLQVPSFEAARQESLREAHAIDPVAPAVAPPAQDPAARMAPAQLPPTGETAIDPAQALNSDYLRMIKEDLAFPSYSGSRLF